MLRQRGAKGCLLNGCSAALRRIADWARAYMGFL
jgi:hypothetical protein